MQHTSYQGHFDASRMQIGIVVSRFNSVVTQKLLEGAIDCLVRHNHPQEDIHVLWVPGAFELALGAKKMIDAHNLDAVICLGAVIRGATDHYDYVCSQAASGISNVSLEAGIPVMFGLLTTNTVEEAMDRAGLKCGNKGFDVTQAAIEMVNALKLLKVSVESFSQ